MTIQAGSFTRLKQIAATLGNVTTHPPMVLGAENKLLQRVAPLDLSIIKVSLAIIGAAGAIL